MTNNSEKHNSEISNMISREFIIKNNDDHLQNDIITTGSRITGVKIAYYFICHTKLWLFSHNITLEDENENVNMGRVLHEDRYKRNIKNITIDDTISVDFIRKGESVVLHEIKKTRKLESSHKWQMLFYLYYLKTKGIIASGEINYPTISKKEPVSLTYEEELKIETAINDIKRIIYGRMPSPKKKNICPKCAYYEFCFGD